MQNCQKIQKIPWTYVLEDLNGEEIVGTFYGKELRNTDRKEFSVGKAIKEKVKNYMSNGKIMIIRLIARSIKKS